MTELETLRAVSIPVSLAAGYILDRIFGDPYNFPHPVRYIGKLINKIEILIRKTCHSSAALKLGGLFLFLMTVKF